MKEFDASNTDAASQGVIENPVLEQEGDDHDDDRADEADEVAVSDCFVAWLFQDSCKIENFVEANEDEEDGNNDTDISEGEKGRSKAFEGENIECQGQYDADDAGSEDMSPPEYYCDPLPFVLDRPDVGIHSYSDQDQCIES